MPATRAGSVSLAAPHGSDNLTRERDETAGEPETASDSGPSFRDHHTPQACQQPSPASHLHASHLQSCTWQARASCLSNSRRSSINSELHRQDFDRQRRDLACESESLASESLAQTQARRMLAGSLAASSCSTLKFRHGGGSMGPFWTRTISLNGRGPTTEARLFLDRPHTWLLVLTHCY